MRAFLYGLATLFALCVTQSVADQSTVPDPSDTSYFIANSEYLNLTISPSGDYLAASARSKDSYGLVFFDARDLSVIGAMKTAEQELIINFFWVNDERVLFEPAEIQSAWERPSRTGELWAVSRDGSAATLLAGARMLNRPSRGQYQGVDDAFASYELISDLPDDPKNVLVAKYPWKRQGSYFYDSRDTFPDVIKLNVNTARVARVETLPYKGATASADYRGNLRYITWRSEEASLRSAYKYDEDLEWQAGLGLAEASAAPRVIGVHPDKNIVFLGLHAGYRKASSIATLDPSTGKKVMLLDSPRSDVTHVFYDGGTSIPVGAISTPAGPRYDYLLPGHPMAQFHRKLAKIFDGQLVDITSSDKQGIKHVIRVESDVNPAEYYLYDSSTNEARFLFANRPWMDLSRLSPKQPLEVTARDGIKIPVLLTLPAVQEDARAPLIIYAHGGPHGVRAPWQFEEEVQLLASRGFAVLQVNHRGSGGYGQVFEEMGYREWGGAIIDDIEDAVAAVRKDNKGRLGEACVYGEYFGAYASVTLATRNPEWLVCAAGFAGVYDLTAKLDRRGLKSLPYDHSELESAIGSDEQELMRFSPVNHAEKVSVPVMLIHGNQDRRVPLKQARQMRDALKDSGKQVELIVDRAIGHGFFDEDLRAAHWDRLIDFFHQSLVSGGVGRAE